MRKKEGVQTGVKAVRPCNGALYKVQGAEQKKKLLELREIWSKRYKVRFSLSATLRRCIDLVHEEEFARKERIDE